MQNCLIILNPRAIPECVDSLEALDIEKLWLTGFTEAQLVEPLNDFVATTDYDNYLIASDDLIVPQQALDTVETLLESHEMATGYCRIADDSPFYNVTRRPITPHGESPSMADYGFYRLEEIDSLGKPEFVSWFGGWTLTGMRRELWLKHPFRVHPVTGIQSDYAVCLDVGRQFASHKHACCRHVRQQQHKLDRSQFILGKVTPVIRHVQRYRQSLVEVPLDNSDVVLSALSSSTPTTDQTFFPILHDKRFPDLWCPGINLDSPQARNLVVALPMWERGGKIAHNYAGNADGIYADNLDWVQDDVFGIVPELNSSTGESHVAHIPFGPSIAAESSPLGFSVSIFVRPSSDVSSNINYIISREVIYAGEPFTNDNYWQISLDHNGLELQLEWVVDKVIGGTDGDELAKDTWHHVCFTIAPKDHFGSQDWESKLYVNGVLNDIGGNHIAAPQDLTVGDIMIGARWSESNEVYNGPLYGRFADARVYNRGLTAGEVWQIAHYPEDLYRPPEAAKLYVDPTLFVPSGGVVVGGLATTTGIINERPDGGVSLGGTASVSTSVTETPSGGATAGGSADESVIYFVTFGGVELGGSAEAVRLLVETPEGGVVLGGESTEVITAGGTAADSLQLWLTGADEDRGEQTDVDLSLGGYRSRTSASRVGILEATAINGVSVLLGSRWNGTSGSLIATDGDSLAYASAGGTVGDSVSIADGEFKVIADSSDPSRFVRVKRTSASDLQGQASLEFHDQIHNVFSMANADDAEHQSGSDKYRAVMLRNESTLPISSGKVWIDTLSAETTTSVQQLGASGTGTIEGAADCFCGWPSKGWARIETSGGTLREIIYYSSRTDNTLAVASRERLGTTASAGAATDTIVAVPGIRIAFEAAVSETVQTIADEETAPTDLTWSTATDSASGLSLSTLNMGDGGALWIHRELPADVAAHSKLYNSIRLQWVWNGVTYNERLNGIYRIADDDLDRYELHIGANGQPDLSQPPDETFTSLPHTTSTTLDSSVTYHFVTNKRNKYDLVSETVSTEIRVDGDGNQQSARPATPEIVRWEATDSGAFLVEVVYFHQADPVELQADSFELYITYNGVDPDLLTDTPVSVAIDEIDKVDSVVMKTYITDSQVAGTVGKIVATTKRSSDGVESLPTAVESATVDDVAPSGDRVGGFYRSVAEQS